MRLSVRSPISPAARAALRLFKDPAGRPGRDVRRPALPRLTPRHLASRVYGGAVLALDVEKRDFPPSGPWMSPQDAAGRPSGCEQVAQEY